MQRQKQSPQKKILAVGLEHRPELRPLSEEEVRFEIDMCIGCDRCMRACPVPLSAMVNIADLNRATISDEIAPHVARFTEECVMCGSCVPVCPVD
ncbi:MAG TPA: 4Fe-4S dicluster domain-containing protein, partial [Ktedonobacteraceae bacterium]|nr:4Fe-4S dicluster domain-containing protein [Ktedonobacteraceae bacterium]